MRKLRVLISLDNYLIVFITTFKRSLNIEFKLIYICIGSEFLLNSKFVIYN